jgi:hypothetical protein
MLKPGNPPGSSPERPPNSLRFLSFACHFGNRLAYVFIRVLKAIQERWGKDASY